MSGSFRGEDRIKATSIGVKIFEKPFQIADIFNWIDQVKKNIDPERELTDLFLQKNINEKIT